MRKILVLLAGMLLLGCASMRVYGASDPTSPFRDLPYDHNYKLGSGLFGYSDGLTDWVAVRVSSAGEINIRITSNTTPSGDPYMYTSTSTAVIVSSYVTTSVNPRTQRKFISLHTGPDNTDRIRFRLTENSNIQTHGDYMDVDEFLGWPFTGAIFIRAEVGVSTQMVIINELW